MQVQPTYLYPIFTEDGVYRRLRYSAKYKIIVLCMKIKFYMCKSTHHLLLFVLVPCRIAFLRHRALQRDPSQLGGRGPAHLVVADGRPVAGMLLDRQPRELRLR